MTIMKTASARDEACQIEAPDSGVLREDPYQRPPEAIAEPPRSLIGILRRTGPGIILAASIVGSGELIATTALGAQVGYAALWVILLSCAVKPIIQAEWGRYSQSKQRYLMATFPYMIQGFVHPPAN